jgi:DNA-binding response OmpR family regulator
MTKWNILLLDDDEDFRQDFQVLLRDRFDVLAVSTVAEFWEALRDHGPFDLLVIDWLLDRNHLSRTAEPILRQLKASRSTTPFRVLTAGKGEVGTSSLVAELGGEIMFKADGGEMIQRIIDAVGSKKRSPQVEERPLEIRLKRSLETEELARQKAVQQEGLAAQKVQEAEKRESDAEEARRRAEAERTAQRDFADEWMEVCEQIVDDSRTHVEFSEELLRFLMRHIAAKAAAIYLNDDKTTVLASRMPANAGGGSRLRTETVHARSLGDLKAISNVLRDLSQHGFAADFARMPVGRRDNFPDVQQPALATAKEIFVQPLCQIVAGYDPQEDQAPDSRQVFGAIIVYPENEHSDTEFQETAKLLAQLPLSAMLHASRDMPFRLYEEKGYLVAALFFAFRFGRSFFKRDINRRRISPWEARKRVVRAFMESFRSIMLFASVAGPLLVMGFCIWQSLHGEDFKLELLKSIGVSVILFTVLLFSIGLLVLYDPLAARALPGWMTKFSRPPEIERTILTSGITVLVLIMVGVFTARVECYSAVRKAANELSRSARVIAAGINIRTEAATDALTDSTTRLLRDVQKLQAESQRYLPSSTKENGTTWTGADRERDIDLSNAFDITLATRLDPTNQFLLAADSTSSSSSENIVKSLAKRTSDYMETSRSIADEAQRRADKAQLELERGKESLIHEMASINEASSIGVLWACLAAASIMCGIAIFMKLGFSHQPPG